VLTLTQHDNRRTLLRTAIDGGSATVPDEWSGTGLLAQVRSRLLDEPGWCAAVMGAIVDVASNDAWLHRCLTVVGV
jgi:hypothetical protein